MKNCFSLVIPAVLFLLLYGCSGMSSDPFDKLSVEWKLYSNSPDQGGTCHTAFIFHNRGNKEFTGSDWMLYFNQMGAMPRKDAPAQAASVEHLGGDFYRLVPAAGFRIPPADSLIVHCYMRGWVLKKTDAPSGLYFVVHQGGKEKILRVKDFSVAGFPHPDSLNPFRGMITMPDAGSLFKENASINQGTVSEGKVCIVPTPVQQKELDGELEISASVNIYYMKGLENEASYLSALLEKITGVRIGKTEGNKPGPKSIILKKGNVLPEENNPEAYHLTVSPSEGVVVEGNTAAGVFYGIQSLLRLIPLNAMQNRVTTFRIPAAEITDAPRFGYRGLHFDVARNFSNKETILKLIDLLAFYKLNTLHLHLTDDEGWRIEIPALPELTSIGSKRAHTLTDANWLHPSYGSGPYADPASSRGTGYYSTREFVEILRYATERHIVVIPEINFPGHARAAIKSMEARYKKLMSQNQPEKAEEFRLIDPADSSVYLSAQAYNDNVVCVVRESVYHFYETVVKALAEMYRQAGAPFQFIHTGGDEVPSGAWTKSPMCAVFLGQHPEIGGPENLQAYFFERLVSILKPYHLMIGGWEEVALKRGGERGYMPNPSLTGQQVVPYVWNSLGDNLDLGYRLANTGYPVVLCFVKNFYFDLAYSADPEEPGLYWGGFVDEKKPFFLMPYDVFRSTFWDDFGRPVDPEKAYANLERLKPEAKKNILGLQAELWSETLRKPEMVEYYLLPKLISFAERAWSPAPAWENLTGTEERIAGMMADWNRFSAKIAACEFPKLDVLNGGFIYRVPPPGAVIENGILKANTAYPGLQIRYTADGSEPGTTSPLYSGPVQVNGPVRLKAFTASGKESRTVTVMP